MEKEIWKKIEGFDKYELSNMGRVKNIELNNIFTGSFRNNNQKVVLIDNNGKQKEKSIAYLIAEKFIDNPNNYKFIDHIDSDKTNNKYNNLKWVKQLVFCNKKFVGANDEEWKIIQQNNNFEVSNKGNIRNTNNKYLIKQQKNHSGYMFINLKTNNKSKSLFVHRIIAEAFLPNIENKKTVDHIDRNRSNNLLVNLRWATSEEQSSNRNIVKKSNPYNKRKIWRIDINKKNNKHLYNNIDEVIDFIINEKLSNGSRISIRQQLNTQLGLNTIQNSCYGYKWEYAEIENLENEVWKNIQDILPKARKYSISNMGRIKNINNMLINGIVKGGYLSVNIYMDNNLDCNTFFVHRLVAELFISNNDNKKIVNHKDGNKLNNISSNLEWCTSSENSIHAINTGLNKNVKKVKVINNITKEETIFMSYTDASKKLNIPQNTLLYNIKRNKIYKNLTFILCDSKTQEELESKSYISNKKIITRKIKVINIETKEETIYNSQRDIKKYLNIATKTIKKYLKSKKPYNNMIFILCDSDIIENKNHIPKNIDKKIISTRIKVTNIETKEETIYETQKDVKLDLHIADKTISKYIKSNKSYKNMLFTKID
jgi:hypothetical protein